MKNSGKIAFSEYWKDYWPEVVFGLVLAVIMFVSTWASRFISAYIYDVVLTPAFNIATSTVGFFGAWVIFKHSEGMLIRKLWGFTLLLWGFGDLSYLICHLVAPMQVMDMSAEHITTFELLIGNILGWTMTLYPTETLRPGWLNWKIVLWQLLPMAAVVAIDYVVPWDLWPIVVLYPYILLMLVLSHIRAYRIWCENNFSSLENIDTQWIIRYCVMFFFIGVNYIYICTTHDHSRAFTQQWFVILMLAYSTEQIIFRKNPWDNVKSTALPDEEQTAGESVILDEAGRTEMVRTLEAWMEKEKPHCNPNMQLLDLRAVLPLNRTYLSNFINDNYGCSFYQFVNRYRIEEAKRLMREHPDMKVIDIATRSGFSSHNIFTRIFTRETGVPPSEWSKKM